MGIYQTYVGVTISIYVIWTIKEILKNEIEVKELIYKIAYSAVMVIGSAVGYLGIFKVLEKVGYLYPTGTRGMNNMLGNMLVRLTEYSDAKVHAFRKFRAPISGKEVHTFPE